MARVGISIGALGWSVMDPERRLEAARWIHDTFARPCSMIAALGALAGVASLAMGCDRDLLAICAASGIVSMVPALVAAVLLWSVR